LFCLSLKRDASPPPPEKIIQITNVENEEMWKIFAHENKHVVNLVYYTMKVLVFPTGFLLGFLYRILFIINVILIINM
jgi:hypothetical protein